uniref:Uncharacterized protein n=1 Tax=Molossus molossus TaxID=27622 RepID=A0A7J8IZT7_MOLMO|nr:hypothetical protein HJG59_010295 [Molossus molossus]
MTTELIPNLQNASNRSISSLVQILHKDLAGWFNWEVEYDVLSFILSILYLLPQLQNTSFLSYYFQDLKEMLVIYFYDFHGTTDPKFHIGSTYIHVTSKYLLASKRFSRAKHKVGFYHVVEFLGQSRNPHQHRSGSR